MNEMPHMTSTNYAAALSTAAAGLVGGAEALDLRQWNRAQALQPMPFGMPIAQSPKQIVENNPMPTTRLVKVFIADPDENVPLDKRLLYRGEETMTDLTDQELFFEVPITDLLSKHNEYRKTLEDKKAKKDKAVMLEPIRVRDLKMLVVALASF